jgi:hypothetical protein
VEAMDVRFDVVSGTVADALNAVITVLTAADAAYEQLRAHPQAMDEHGGMATALATFIFEEQAHANRNLTALFDYTKVGERVIDSFKDQMGWSTDTVIALNREFVDLIKKSEIGAKYSGFIEAIQKKGTAATALWMHWEEGLFFQVIGQTVNELIKPYINNKVLERQKRLGRKPIAVMNMTSRFEEMAVDDDEDDNFEEKSALDKALCSIQKDLSIAKISTVAGYDHDSVVSNIITEMIDDEFEIDAFVAMLDRSAMVERPSQAGSFKCFHCGEEHRLGDCSEFKTVISTASKPLTELIRKYQREHGDKGASALSYQILKLEGWEKLKKLNQGTSKGFKKNFNKKDFSRQP